MLNERQLKETIEPIYEKMTNEEWESFYNAYLGDKKKEKKKTIVENKNMGAYHKLLKLNKEQPREDVTPTWETFLNTSLKV